MTSRLLDPCGLRAQITRRTPAGRWRDGEELVGATVFPAGAGLSSINAQVLYVDGGITASI